MLQIHHIFSRNQVREKVASEHEGIYKKIILLSEAVAGLGGPQDPTLLMLLSSPRIPNVADADKVLKTMSLLTMTMEEAPDFAAEGWDEKDVKILNNRKSFIQDIRVKKILTNPMPKLDDLCEASTAALKASGVMPFKIFVHFLKLESKYYGALPNTTSVRKASRSLFGSDFGGLKHVARATNFFNDLAASVNSSLPREEHVSPTYINTALHLLGKKLETLTKE